VPRIDPERYYLIEGRYLIVLNLVCNRLLMRIAEDDPSLSKTELLEKVQELSCLMPRFPPEWPGVG
jgi:hypothetical protein